MFALSKLRCKLTTDIIRRVFFLPNLASIPRSKPRITKILGLQKRLLPILGLQIYLNGTHRHGALQRTIVLIRCGNRHLNLIMSSVRGIRRVTTTSVSAGLRAPCVNETRGPLATKLTGFNRGVVVLLRPRTLVEKCKTGANRSAIRSSSLRIIKGTFVTRFPPRRRGVLRSQTLKLTRVSADRDFTKLTTLTIIDLRNRHFTLKLRSIRRFASIPRIAPVPYYPSRVINGVGLQNRVLALISVHHFLGLTPDTRCGPSGTIIVHLKSLITNVIMSRIFSIICLRPTRVTTVPDTVRSDRGRCLGNVTQCRSSVVDLLSLPGLLARNRLIIGRSK